jgi:energy-coupling factor transporter ATP-binding protein EcfA2
MDEPWSPAGAPFLHVERLEYCYPDGHVALRGISFSVGPREVVGLIGPNGAGKTTLMLHLNGLLPGPDGSSQRGGEAGVRVAGLPLVKANLPTVRRLVGFLFQDPDDQLFCPTVREDVAFGPLNLGLPRGEILALVSESLAAVGLQGFEHRSTQHLSFGERKRVCLAGVLACRPELLVLDEPSSNLDPRARRRFIELLKACATAQLIATHDLELVLELCSRVLLLDQGQIQADGPTAEILSDARLLERHGLEVPLSIQLGGRLPSSGEAASAG